MDMRETSIRDFLPSPAQAQQAIRRHFLPRTLITYRALAPARGCPEHG